MKQPKVIKLRVKLEIEGSSLPVGDLAWSQDDRLAAFEYHPDALKTQTSISPIRIKLAPGVTMGPQSPFEGLHGVFADSLPDGWGRILVNRQVTKNGGNPTIMTPIDRLAIVGSRGMGALTYAPETLIIDSASNEPIDIDWFANQAEMILDGRSDEGVSKLLEASGGSAGVRPKIMVLRDPSNNTFHIDDGVNNHHKHEHWLVKLKYRLDGPGIGNIEHAYAKMAKAAGINFPDTILIQDKRGTEHFAVKRFDRNEAGRLHVHTLAGLTNADFKIPSLDYLDLLKATRILTGDQLQVEEAFRRMVFNVIAGNRDDHPKNHAYLMNKIGKWSLSPAYDLTPSEGMGGEHNLTIAGEGKTPSKDNLSEVAIMNNIPAETATKIIDGVAEAISSWRSYADNSGVYQSTITNIAKIIDINAKYALGKGTIVKNNSQAKFKKAKPKSSARRSSPSSSKGKGEIGD